EGTRPGGNPTFFYQMRRALADFRRRVVEQIAPPDARATGGEEPLPPAPEPNGPFGSDGFRYRGVEVRFGRGVKQRSLVLALWDAEQQRPRDARSIEDVLTEVYGQGHETADAAFRQLCADTRRRLESAAMPLTIENLQGNVQLRP